MILLLEAKTGNMKDNDGDGMNPERIQHGNVLVTT